MYIIYRCSTECRKAVLGNLSSQMRCWDSILPVELVVVIVGLPPEVSPHQEQEEWAAQEEEPRAFPLQEKTGSADALGSGVNTRNRCVYMCYICFISGVFLIICVLDIRQKYSSYFKFWGGLSEVNPGWGHCCCWATSFMICLVYFIFLE